MSVNFQLLNKLLHFPSVTFAFFFKKTFILLLLNASCKIFPSHHQFVMPMTGCKAEHIQLYLRIHRLQVDLLAGVSVQRESDEISA